MQSEAFACVGWVRKSKKPSLTLCAKIPIGWCLKLMPYATETPLNPLFSTATSALSFLES